MTIFKSEKLNNLIKKVFFTFNFVMLIILGLSFQTQQADAVILKGEELKKVISEELNYKYTKNNPDGKIIVQNVADITVNSTGERLLVDANCDFNTAGRNKLARIVVLDNGKVIRNFVVPVTVQSFDSVLVAKTDIQKGEYLSVQNVALEKRDIGVSGINTISEVADIQYLCAGNSIKAGQIIDKRFLTKQSAVLRNSQVKAVFSTGGINLTLDVISLENGGMGDYIRVKSKDYNKIYQGKVVGPNQVLIQI